MSMARSSDQPRKTSSTGRKRRPRALASPPPEVRVVAEDPIDDGAHRPSARPFPVVGIGASAGGLEAVSAVLKALPADTHMAFVLVQHLAPSHQSLMSELLQPCTSMPVLQVRDGMAVESDHVYVIPPDCNMGIMNGVLHLLPRGRGSDHHMPIDFFLRTLATDQKNHAIGVILSGTASDGALGLRAVKGEGGITIAQDPKTAKYDGMPRAAIGAGAVDLVLSADAIAGELAKIGRHPYVLPRHEDLPEADDQLKRIFFLLRQFSGVDFTYYKPATIKRRLKRRMVLHKVDRLPDYVRLLQQAPTEIEALYQDMLIHVTGFFREPEAFEALRQVVFPAILANRPDDLPIRIWVPGCSTGEETYSIAIALLEYLDGRPQQGTRVQIFATDVSQAAIDKARAGFYPDNIKADVPPDRLRRFFAPVDGGYRVAKIVRDMCIFARQDLTKDPPFSQLDLVSCRNVMIYLGSILQKRAMTIFHYALNPTGFLLLGASETIGSYADLFAIADKKHKIYTKKTTVVRPYIGFATDYTQDRVEVPMAPRGGRARVDLQSDVDRLLLARLAPTGVVVNSDLQIVQVRGQTGKYLQPAAGEATLNVLKMARPGLMIELRTAFHTARKRNLSVEKRGVRVKQNGHVGLVDIEVVPLETAGGEKLWLILFRDAPASATPLPLVESKARRARAPSKKQERTRVRELEQELTATREYLQSIIHDQEATNEELQSANEEILSSNEELQSTNEELETAKEELQSTNEELNTVNEELQTRNHELSHVNNDLTNLLASVHIPIIMIGNDLRIRRFTPMAGQVFNLIASDVGRPITDIKPKLDIPDFDRLITQAIDTVQLQEREVQGPDGRSFFMRLRPYKTSDNRIDGCVVALVDLPARRPDLRSDLRELPLVVLDEGLRIAAVSSRFCEEIGAPQAALRGERFDRVQDGLFATPPLLGVLHRLAATDASLEELQHRHTLPDRDGTRWCIGGCRLPVAAGAVLLVVERDRRPAGAGGATPGA
jgi:two-component system CheB/CheR fusion protein